MIKNKFLLLSLALTLFAGNVYADTYTVFYGSARTNRQGKPVADLIVKELKDKGHMVHFVDPLIYDFPLLDKRLTDYEEGKAPKKMVELGNIIQNSDGFVFVSPIYNSGVPSALKNILDHYVPPFYENRPVGIVTYSVSDFAGVQIISPLRDIAAGLAMISVPTSFSIPKMTQAFKENGTLKDAELKKRLDRFITQLEEYTEALKPLRSER